MPYINVVKFLDRPHNAMPSNTTVKDYLTTWLRDVVTVRNRPRTLESYGVIVNRHIIPALGAIQLRSASAGRYRPTRSTMSKSTGQSPEGCYAKGHDSPGQATDPPKPGRYEVQVPEAEGISRILDLAQGTTYGPVLWFMAFMGCRRGEAVAFKWENVDLDRGIVSIVESARRLQGRGIVFQRAVSYWRWGQCIP